jgi:hypothetical protein
LLDSGAQAAAHHGMIVRKQDSDAPAVTIHQLVFILL